MYSGGVGGLQRGWLPVSKGQLVQFSGNLAVVIERTRAHHTTEHANPRSLFFTATFFFPVFDYNSLAMQENFLCLHFYTGYAISIED